MSCEFCEKFKRNEIIKGIFLFLFIEFWGNVSASDIFIEKIPFAKDNSLFFMYGVCFIVAIILFHDTLISSLKQIKKLKANPIVITWLIVIIAMIAIAIILDNCGVTNYNQDGVEAEETSGIFILYAVTIVFFGPVVEELVYRFFIFRTIRKYSVIMAHMVTALLFALSHVWKYALLYREPMILFCMLTYISLGVGASVLYDKYKNLLYPIILHMALNAFATFG